MGHRRTRGAHRASPGARRRAARGREAEVGETDWAQVERVVLVRTIDSLWVEHLTELDDMRRGIGLRGYAQQDPLNEFRREAFRLYEELRGLIRHGVATSIFRVTVERQPAGRGSRREPGPRRGAAALARSARTARMARQRDGRPARDARAWQRCRPVPRPARPRPARRSCAAPAAGAGDASRARVARRRGRRERRRNGAARPPAPGGARPGYTPTGERIGRNDPCWCGSGAKYKKCHGR